MKAIQALNRGDARQVLQLAEALGSPERWHDATTIEAEGLYGGAMWEFKGVPDFAGADHIAADIHRQHITLAHPSGRVIEFDKDADVVTVTAPDGTAERLEHPRASFDGYTFENQWSIPQAAYFRAYATWLSLIGAYVLTYPGVEIMAASPWVEDGKTWRGLRATFPETIDTHSVTQLYYFDAEGRLALLCYEAQVNGGAPTAHYQPEHVTADGLVVATRHEVFARNAGGTPDRSWMPISLDLSGITVR
jgi:hypothetical protein